VSSSAPIVHRFAQISPTDSPAVDTRNVPHQDGALERHFSIKEIAELWGLCENSVRELFKQEARCSPNSTSEVSVQTGIHDD